MSFELADPQEWWITIPPELHHQHWQNSQAQTTESCRWQTYLNQLALHLVLDWLEWIPGVRAERWLNERQAATVWEFVTGATVIVGTERWVVIPSEVIEDDLEVPQEWVDIPSWAGDFYVGVQVCEDGTARIWGVTTHQQIKQVGDYDADDRTYFVDKQFLLTDLTAFEIIREQGAETATRAVIAPLSPLSNAQVENLVQRLGGPDITFPRLQVPFTLWGALIADEAARQRLYEQRTGQSVPRLSDWLNGAVSHLWQTLEDWLATPTVATEWRGEEFRLSTSLQPMVFEANRVKVLKFGDQGESQVALVLGVSVLSEAEVSIGLQVCALGDRSPEMIQVRLLNAQGGEEGQARAAQTENIQLQFEGQRGETFSVEVCCGEQCVTETFRV
jgi:hypothetical protein